MDNPQYQAATCNMCGRPVCWVILADGSRMPYDIDSDGILDVCHFETCEPHKRWLARRYAKMFPAKTPDLQFIIRGIPTTHTMQQKGYCRDDKAPSGVRVFTKAPQRADMAYLIYTIGQQLPREWVPREDGCKVQIGWSFPQRKSDKLMGDDYLPHIHKPDLDNLEKGLLDAMERAGVYKSDAQIWNKHTTKVHRIVPRTVIRVWFDGKADRRAEAAEQGTFDFRA